MSAQFPRESTTQLGSDRIRPPAESLLGPVHPSRRILNTATKIAAAAAARLAGEEQVLGFTPRDFVVFGLPYKNPRTSLYARRNGWMAAEKNRWDPDFPGDLSGERAPRARPRERARRTAPPPTGGGALPGLHEVLALARRP
jgi:hypothetical protein